MSLPPPLPVNDVLLVPRTDFPTWLPAMLVKELRQGLRARGFVGVFIVFQGVMIVTFLWAFASGNESPGFYNGLNGFFWALVSAFLMFLTPLRGLGALRDEIDAKSIDLLLLTPLKSWQIVLGKWASLMAQASLLLVSVLPYAVVRYFFGSVNLVEDFGMIAVMFGASGVLTAVALWFSGMPKAIRVVLPVLMVVGLQGSFMSMVFWRSMGGGGPRTTLGFSGGPNEFLGIIDSALLLVFFLHQAVRRLAPPAENHAFVTRLLALAIMLPVPFLHFLHIRSGEKWEASLAFIVLMIISAAELAGISVLMRVHWTSWLKKGGLSLAVGRLFLPGWPSAALFAAVALTLSFLASHLAGLHTGAPWVQHAWITVLAWEALVFPAVLISFLPARSVLRASGASYFALHALIGVICLISENKAAGFILGPFASILDFLCHYLPVASFWLGATELGQTTPSSAQYGMQFMVFAAVVMLFAYTSHSYWARIKAWRVGRDSAVASALNQSA